LHAKPAAASIENLKSKTENNEVLALADLSTWTFAGTALAVLGHPIKHSVSPAMHNAALAAMAGSDQTWLNWRYFRFDVPPEQLPEALKRLHAAGFHGLNLTVPHKVLAFDLVEEVDPAARPIGAVNTLRRTATGWRGFNTDGYGLAAALREDLGVNLPGAAVVLLGAGGAARGAAVECLQRECACLWIGNRTRANLDAMLDELRPLAPKIPLHGFSPEAGLPAEAAGRDDLIVINATSAGLKAGDAPPMDLRRLPPGTKVYDMIYNPPQTGLLRQAAELGHKQANGLSMLVHQGAKSLEIWTGRAAADNAPVMQAAARVALAAPH